MTKDASPLDRLLDVRLQLPLDVHRFLIESGGDLEEAIGKAVEAYLARAGTPDPRSN